MPQIVDSPRWVRVYQNKQLIADSRQVKLVIENYHAAYYFPLSDIKVDPTAVKGASAIPDLPDHYTFEWQAMDHWYEEEEEVYVDARNPYWRVDCVHSSRHIEVVIGDTKVADTHHPCLLFETNLIPRFYIPQHDCRLDLLEPSETTSLCPYKGEAHYYSVQLGDKLHKDLVWYYRYPMVEAPKVQGMLCFYNEKVDVYENGEKLARPKSPLA